ncbi:phenylalanine--tRNA ligase subunit beta [Aerococcus urinaehominis]|uniref:Phenylalanine--tRNA ligase beta subunit n=1 Tax=Aerococcus urinaehominis TaxID=128944 RepID=A0A0X8FKS6_9LACT|nr:phenylalanine--tRNA ligase subunit beta [Aerococcus urinaehominis]AMB98899.1 phenylalanine--tRNA ligase subunit beta [Aerococcus urinaehominis]SDM60835.1 phenylalanyl-tRNA synthetase beta subunit [Aerococcus urinaehominis]
MYISYQWLKDLVDLSDIDVDRLSQDMSLTGLEVEGVDNLGAGLKKIVVGHVLECEDHPDSDHLHICQVDVGEEEAYQIVCGAPNVAAGQKVIVALPNSRIAGNVKIKKGKLRGQVSMGMICSLEELGISNAVVPKAYADGIMVLDEDAPIGTSIVDYLHLDDPVIEVDITPNRADALSMYGVAHEVAAIYDKAVSLPEVDMSAFSGDLQADFDLVVDDPDLVPEYNAFMVKNIKVAESPLWLQMRLIKAGVRPINNVVDITNLVLMTYGQPLHAFDYDRLGSGKIQTRLARPGETLVTLDGVERQLTSEDIVITDGSQPVALAGVMGGLATEVEDDTTTVLIEAAAFEPGHIRTTARKFGLRSESSLRNERGINVATIQEAGAYAAQLMVELAGGEIVAGVASQSHLDKSPIEVSTSVEYINSQLGMTMTYDEIAKIFDQLAFEMTGDESNQFTVAVPRRRWDIAIPEDLVEEVARIYGYDKIPSSLPEIVTTNVGLSASQALQRHSRQIMEALGFDQVVAYSLVSPDESQAFPQNNQSAIQLDFPMSQDRQVMRKNLVGSLMTIAAYNSNRKNKNLQLYELASLYNWQDDGQVSQTNHLAGLWTGQAQTGTWQHAAKPVDFYALKGKFVQLLASYQLKGELVFKANTDLVDMHPGRTADVFLVDQAGTSHRLGYLGQVHPQTASRYDLDEVYIFEISLSQIEAADKIEMVQEPLAKVPGSSRDIALLVDDQVTNQEILDLIKASASQYLVNIRLFDLYQGDNISAGKKSMAYQLHYLNPQETLRDEEVNQDIEKITKALEEQLGASIR